MKYTIHVERICPFVNRECIGDGFIKHTPEGAYYRPCLFFDEYASYGVEPCKLKRAVNRINKEPDYPSHKETIVDVPWNNEKE